MEFKYKCQASSTADAEEKAEAAIMIETNRTVRGKLIEKTKTDFTITETTNDGDAYTVTGTYDLVTKIDGVEIL